MGCFPAPTCKHTSKSQSRKALVLSTWGGAGRGKGEGVKRLSHELEAAWAESDVALLDLRLQLRLVDIAFQALAKKLDQALVLLVA